MKNNGIENGALKDPAHRFRRWIMIVAFMGMVLLGITALFNYVMDPLWCFDINHQWNQKQNEINGRIQKTNYLLHHDHPLDAVIFGSSVVTFISHRDFPGRRVFNYAFNGMRSEEIPPFLAFAQRRKRAPIETIYLGLDFIDSTGAPAPGGPSAEGAQRIIDDASTPWYIPGMLLSIDTFVYSRDNYLNRGTGKLSYYNRDLVKEMKRIPRNILRLTISESMRLHHVSTAPFALSQYQYNAGYRRQLETIRAAAGAATLVVFTNPSAGPFYELLVGMGHLDDYLRWLSDIVEVFGSCYHFSYPQEISHKYLDNFTDIYHFYPSVGTQMVLVMSGSPQAQPGFGMLLTRGRFAEQAKLLRARMSSYRALYY